MEDDGKDFRAQERRLLAMNRKPNPDLDSREGGDASTPNGASTSLV